MVNNVGKHKTLIGVTNLIVIRQVFQFVVSMIVLIPRLGGAMLLADAYLHPRKMPLIHTDRWIFDILI